MGAIQYGHIEAFTNYNYRQRQVVINGQRRTRQYAERVISLPPSDPFRAERYAYETRLIVGILASLSLAIGLVAGGLFMVFCWHLERPKRVWILFAPLLTGAFVYWIWTNETVDLRDWGLARIGLHAFLQCVGLVLGMRFGRPLTRFGLRFLLPVRLVQHFAFLWLVDGRKIPRAGPDRVE
jgi:hypothetical protein